MRHVSHTTPLRTDAGHRPAARFHDRQDTMNAPRTVFLLADLLIFALAFALVGFIMAIFLS